MKDTKEIVLIFKEKYEYSNVEVASLIKERFEELGEPTILPDSKNTPKIIFNSNPEFLMNINEEYLSFLINTKYSNDLSKIIFDIVDIFEDKKIFFKKIGMIANIFLSPSMIDIVKKKYINIDMESDFNLSWYKKIEIKDYELNCWTRYIVDLNHFKELLIQFDINTKVEDEIKFDMKFIKEFINKANDYIEKNTKL